MGNIEEKHNNILEGIDGKNLIIQIDFIIEEFLKRIANKKDKNLDVKIRAFVPTFDIEFIKTIRDEIEFLLFEDYEFDSSEEDFHDLYINRKPVDFQKERDLNTALQVNGFIKDVREEIIHDSSILKNYTVKDDKFEKIMGDRFIVWIKNRDNIKKLLLKNWDKYDDVFTKFDLNELIDRLTLILKHVFIRRVRSKYIMDYILENYQYNIKYFNSYIKDYVIETFNKKPLYNLKFTKEEKENIKRLSSIASSKAKTSMAVNWFEREKNNFKNRIYSEYDIDESYFEGLGTNQNIIVVDILARNGDGTTIKIASYDDLNQEFNRIQACRLFGKNNLFPDDQKDINTNFKKIQKIAQELRNSFFKVLIERRYLIQGRDVLKETCDEILKELSLSDDEKEIISNLDPMFLRSFVYKIAYKKAIEKSWKLYVAFKLAKSTQKDN